MSGVIVARSVAAMVATVALVLVATMPAVAHETGAIYLASSRVPVGGELVLRGERLDRNADLVLEARGVLDHYRVGTVHTDAKGAFQARLTLPPHVPAGAYTLVVLAPDGDISARADLIIGPAAGAGTAGRQEMPAVHATAELMAVQHTTTTAEWVVIIALIALSFGGGAVLLGRGSLRPTRRSEGSERGS